MDSVFLMFEGHCSGRFGFPPPEMVSWGLDVALKDVLSSSSPVSPLRVLSCCVVVRKLIVLV